MIITVKKSASEKDLERLEKDLREKGLQIHKSIGDEFNVWGLVTWKMQMDTIMLVLLPEWLRIRER